MRDCRHSFISENSLSLSDAYLHSLHFIEYIYKLSCFVVCNARYLAAALKVIAKKNQVPELN